MRLLSVSYFLAFLDICYRLLSGFSIGLLQHASYNKDMVHNKVRDELPGGVLYDMGNHTSIGVLHALEYF
jgi:hypothetical protein